MQDCVRGPGVCRRIALARARAGFLAQRALPRGALCRDVPDGSEQRAALSDAERDATIICQLGFKEETDLELLYACIEPSLVSREFFLQKAIGWALRQYAWTDGSEIKRYVRINRNRLSALSCREAMKNI